MSDSRVYKPVIFFGKKVYILFAAIMSIPVWLASNIYLHRMQVHDDEAAATGVAMCFFAGIFTGRYIAEIWTPYLKVKPRRLMAGMTTFIIICLCWLFIHVDFPIGGSGGIDLLLYLLPFMAMSLAIGILIKAMRTLAQKELNDARRSAAQSESELRLLQSQLSPHFLFNTLNNMYGLSITEHEKIPPLLLQLSDLLRYSVYGTNEMLVPLKEEVNYLNNYIAFEKMRLGERLVLETDIEAPGDKTPLIAPMLFIVFIENAFKHSKNTAEDKVFVNIGLRSWNDFILFSVKNSHSRQEKPFDKNSGFGLENVRKRLELLYPDAYKLDIEEDERLYSVTLYIKLKK